MPFVFSHVEYCDMHFVYGFCNGNAHVAVEEYQRRFSNRRIPSRGVFSRINQTLRDTGCLPCVAVRSETRWYERLTHERIFLRWFREVHVCPLVEWPLASAYHVCRCDELYMKKIYIFTMIKGTTSGTRRPCSTYGFVPLDNSTSRTVKRYFIHK